MAFPAHLFPPRAVGGGGLLNKIERRVSRLGTVEFVVGAAAVVLVLDHVIAPKGKSLASKALRKVMPGGFPLLPPVIPPPGVGVPAAIAKGDFAGANQMAGWNRGMSNYGQWSDFPQWHGHAGPWHGMYYPNYPWSE